MFIKQQQQIKRLLKKQNKKNLKIFSKKIVRKKTKSWQKIRWEQRLVTAERKNFFAKQKKIAKFPKSDLYQKLLKKIKANFHFTNFYLLNAFLTRSGKIKSRNITKLTVIQQKRISRLVQKARNFGLIPFVSSVSKVLQSKWQKRQQKLKNERLKKKLQNIN